MNAKIIGANIKVARKATGITQEQLSERIDCSTNSVIRYESGERTPNGITLTKIADVLKVPVSQLLGEEPTQTAEPEPAQETNQPERGSLNAVEEMIYTLAQDGNVAEFKAALKAAILAYGAKRSEP